MRAPRRDDRGSATVLMAGLLGVSVMLAMAAVVVAGYALAARRARVGADMAALSGAAAVAEGRDPCLTARGFGSRNGVEVVGCSLAGDSVEFVLTVRVRLGIAHPLPGLPAEVECEAHAGPVAPAGDPGPESRRRTAGPKGRRGADGSEGRRGTAGSRADEGRPVRRADEGRPVRRTDQGRPIRRVDEGGRARRADRERHVRRADRGRQAVTAAPTGRAGQAEQAPARPSPALGGPAGPDGAQRSGGS